MMKVLIPLLILLLTLTPQARAATYFKVDAGTAQRSNNGAANESRVLTNADDPEAGHGILSYYNRNTIDPGNNPNTHHYLGGTDFGYYNGGSLIYNEGTHGYIGSSVAIGFELHLEEAAFRGDDFLQLYYIKNPSGNPSMELWNQPLLDPPIDTGSAAVGDASQDVVYYHILSSEELGTYTDWQGITGYTRDGTNLGRGFAVRLQWEHPSGTASPTRAVAVDHIFIRVLQKLLVYGVPVNSGATVTEGVDDLELLQLVFNPYDNTTVSLNSFQVDLVGTNLLPADISKVKFYEDKDNSGTVSAGDALIAEIASPASLTGISFAASPLIGNIRRNSRYLVAVDIADTACATVAPKYIGAYIADHTGFVLDGSLDELVTQAERDAVGVNDAVNPATLFPIQTGASDPARVKILKKPSLSATLLAPVSPVSIDMGQTFQVQIQVSSAAGNYGTAENVLLATPLTETVITPAPAALTSDIPLPQTLIPGASYTWTLTYTGTAAGQFQYSGFVNYDDPGNGDTGLSTGSTALSSTVTIIYKKVPILLISGMSLTPATASDDQQLTLATTVTNAGEGTAWDVRLKNPTGGALWTFEKNGAPVVIQDSTAGSTETLLAGQSKIWTYTFTPTAPTSGTVYYRITAEDGSASTSATGNSNQISIQKAADLAISAGNLYPSGNPVGVNSTFNIVLRVDNTGEAGAIDVLPSPPTIAGSNAEQISGPTVNGNSVGTGVSIAGGASADFVWVYNTRDLTGTFTIGNGDASGKDVNSHFAKNTGAPVSYAGFVIDNNVYPRYTRTTNGAVDLLIAYSSTSNYYALSNAGRLYKYSNIGTELINIAVPNGDIPTGNNVWLSELDGREILFFGTVSGRIYSFDGTNGTGFWTPTSFANSFTSLSNTPIHGIMEYNSNLYVSSGNYLFKMDSLTGQTDPYWPTGGWQTTVQVDSIPAVDNTFVYVGAANGRVYAVRDSDGTDGGNTGTTDTNKQYTAPFLWDGVLYCSNNGGRIIRVTDPTSALSTYSSYYNAGKDFCDVWYDFTASPEYLWASDQGGGNLYKIDPVTMSIVSGWPKNPGSVNGSAVTHVSAPLIIFGRVYCGSYDAASTRGKAWVLSASDAVEWTPAWPYVSPNNNSAMYTPVTLDLSQAVFLLGSQDNNVYVFSNP